MMDIGSLVVSFLAFLSFLFLLRARSIGNGTCEYSRLRDELFALFLHFRFKIYKFTD